MLIQTVSLPVNYLIMMSLFVLAGSHAPTAVVMHDHGPYARQFVAAMRQADSFRLEVETGAAAARRQMHAGNPGRGGHHPGGLRPGGAPATSAMALPVQVNNLDAGPDRRRPPGHAPGRHQVLRPR